MTIQDGNISISESIESTGSRSFRMSRMSLIMILCVSVISAILCYHSIYSYPIKVMIEEANQTEVTFGEFIANLFVPIKQFFKQIGSAVGSGARATIIFFKANINRFNNSLR